MSGRVRSSAVVSLAIMVGAISGASATAPAVPETPPASLVPAQTIEDAGATRLTVIPPADWLLTTPGWLWGAVGRAVLQFDGEDGSKLVRIAVPGETCLAMDAGFDAVWVGACQSGSPSIVRIDPATATAAATIPLTVDELQWESSVAAGEGAVWAVSHGVDKVLVRIDPATDTVAATYPIEGVIGDLGGVRAGYGGIWVAVPSANSVLHIDPSDGSVVASITVGTRPRFMAIGEGSVWAMNEGDGTVSRIDPATDTAVSIPVTPTRVDGGDIAVGGGYVWARISDQLVAKLDPATDTVVARYGPPAGSGSVAVDDAAAWISAHDVNAIWRLPLR